MKLRFTYRVLNGLGRSRAFIAKNNPQAVRRISQALLHSIYHLVNHPGIGHLLTIKAVRANGYRAIA